MGTIFMLLVCTPVALLLLVVYLLYKEVGHNKRMLELKREFLDKEFNQRKQDAEDKLIDAEAYDAALKLYCDYRKYRADWIMLFGEDSVNDFRHIALVPPGPILHYHMGAVSKYHTKNAWHNEVWSNYCKFVEDFEKFRNFI